MSKSSTGDDRIYLTITCCNHTFICAANFANVLTICISITKMYVSYAYKVFGSITILILLVCTHKFCKCSQNLHRAPCSPASCHFAVCFHCFVDYGMIVSLLSVILANVYSKIRSGRMMCMLLP